MFWFSIFFFLSGLCSLVYELVWLRLAMARFGVTTALVSILLSVFMAGLGAGSWLEGLGGNATVSSGAFYLLSGAWLALTLIPWCACMGATIPLAMFAIQSAR